MDRLRICLSSRDIFNAVFFLFMYSSSAWQQKHIHHYSVPTCSVQFSSVCRNSIYVSLVKGNGWMISMVPHCCAYWLYYSIYVQISAFLDVKQIMIERMWWQICPSFKAHYCNVFGIMFRLKFEYSKYVLLLWLCGMTSAGTSGAALFHHGHTKKVWRFYWRRRETKTPVQWNRSYATW